MSKREGNEGMQQTFTYNGATVTVRQATIRDRLTRNVVLYNMGEGDTVSERYMRGEFASLIVQTASIDGELSFALPGADATETVLNAAYEQWLQQDAALYDAWTAALARVDAPTNPVEKKADTP